MALGYSVPKRGREGAVGRSGAGRKWSGEAGGRRAGGGGRGRGCHDGGGRRRLKYDHPIGRD